MQRREIRAVGNLGDAAQVVAHELHADIEGAREGAFAAESRGGLVQGTAFCCVHAAQFAAGVPEAFEAGQGRRSEYSYAAFGNALQTPRDVAPTLACVKVFLVEDAPLLRERLQGLVEAIPGASMVGHASGAQEAVQAILSARPDVVVLDIHLAQGSGFDVLRALRAAAFAPAVYVLTNYPQDAYRRLAEGLGARGFFDKSSEFDRLREALAARAE